MSGQCIRTMGKALGSSSITEVALNENLFSVDCESNDASATCYVLLTIRFFAAI